MKSIGRLFLLLFSFAVLAILLAFPRLTLAAASFTSFTNVDWANAVVRQGDYIWVASTGGLVVRRLSDGAWAKFTTADAPKLLNNEVERVVVDAGGRKWIGTVAGLSVLDDGGTPLTKSDDQWQSYTTADGMGNGFVNGLTIDSAGRKWMATYNGVSVLDDLGTPFDKTGDQWYTFVGGQMCTPAASVTIDSLERKWIGCLWEGVRVLDDNGTLSNTADDQWQNFTDVDGLRSGQVREVVVDSGGRKWIASLNGANVLDDNGTPFNKTDDHWQSFSSADSGLANNPIRSFTMDIAGNKWFGTDNGVSSGVSVLNDRGTPLDKSDDQWITFTQADGLAPSWLGRLLDIEIDPSGIKWIATQGSGVSKLDDAGTTFTKSDDTWQTFATTNGQIAANYINDIEIDAAGRKWIATGGGGANVLDDNGTPSNQSDDTWQTFLSGSIVYSVAIDTAGKKWFGLHDYYILVFDDSGTPFNTGDDTWARFDRTNTPIPGFDIITNITVDSTNRKWFSTNASGIYVLNDNGTPLNGSDDQWGTFTTSDSGLASNKPSQITIDSVGRKWIPHNGGVSVLDDNGTPFTKGDDQWTTFTTSDGLPNFPISVVRIDSGGRKWIGAVGGGMCVLDDGGTPFTKTDDLPTKCFTQSNGLAGDWVYDFIFEGTNRVWIGGSGITLLNHNGTPFNTTDDQWLTFHSSDGSGLASDAVWGLAQEGQNMWIPTAGGLSVLLNYPSVIFNQPPTVSAGGPYTVGEGGTTLLIATGSDPEGGALTYAWDLDNNGSFETPGASVTFSAVGKDGPGSQTVVVKATDNGGLFATSQTNVTIQNVAPTVGAITGPTAPIPVNTVASTSASFADSGALDTHTAVWNWGDGATSAGTITETNGSGSVVGSHAYTSPGVYAVNLTVIDKDGASGQATPFQYIVVFDSTAGFVTGSGNFNSPAGAYPAEPAATGKAHFGFTVKYLQNDPAPSGSSQFRFRAGGINLSSSTFVWLVITSPKAMFRGTGTLEGNPGTYTFIVSMYDAQAPGGTGDDKFRIKITDGSGAIVYDNQFGAPETDDPITTLTGGSIVIH